MTCPNAPVLLEMRSGRVALSLTMGQLYVVWRLWPSIWSEFNRIVSAKKRTLDDIARLLYAASCCADVAEGREATYVDIEAFESDLIGDVEAIYEAYESLVSPKKSTEFRDAFERRAKKSSSGIRMPRFKLQEPDDYYVYMVIILGIDESLFWDADFAFLWDVAKSKGAFDAWLMGERERRR